VLIIATDILKHLGIWIPGRSKDTVMTLDGEREKNHTGNSPVKVHTTRAIVYCMEILYTLLDLGTLSFALH
jgi:hypothetical protein